MQDRELLELAAKAAGIEIYEDHEGFTRKSECGASWNPLESDGDALRLAVKLKLLIDIDEIEAVATVTYPHFHTDESEIINGDSCAATRRAIVRAAAEIGKTK